MFLLYLLNLMIWYAKHTMIMVTMNQVLIERSNTQHAMGIVDYPEILARGEVLIRRQW